MGGKTLPVGPDDVRVADGDLYVRQAVLQTWLPIDIAISTQDLIVTLTPRESMPVAERLARQQAGASLVSLHAPAAATQQCRAVDFPIRLASIPTVDQTITMGVSGGRGLPTATTAGSNTYFSGDLLGLEASGYLGVAKGTRNVARFTLGHHDPYAGLLGPLGATQFAVGSVVLPSVRNITGGGQDGLGAFISNAPLSRSTSFDSHTFQGALPSGWDVELLSNDALVGYQASRGDGQYLFANVPLNFGSNAFTLVFHGPQGQIRTEQAVFLTDEHVKRGEVIYSAGLQRSRDGATHSIAQVETGITDRIVATAGTSSISDFLAGSHGYANAGLRAYTDSAIYFGNVVKQSAGGAMGELGMRGRIGDINVNASTAHLQNFVSDVYSLFSVPVKSRQDVQVSNVVTPSSLFRLPLSFEYKRDALVSGVINQELDLRTSGRALGAYLTNTLQLQSLGGAKTLGGEIDASRRMGDTDFSALLGYTVKPVAQMQTLNLAANRIFQGGYNAGLGLNHVFANRQTFLQASLGKTEGAVGYAVTASATTQHDYGIALQVYSSFGYDPRTTQIMIDALSQSSNGAASAVAYLEDDDGVKHPLAGARFLVNGVPHPHKTDQEGYAYLDHLQTTSTAVLSLDPDSIEDPHLMPVEAAVRILPRPGATQLLDFVMVPTTEIDGTVFTKRSGRKIGVGAITVVLMDAAGKALQTIETDSDGYYLINRVRRGAYTLKVADKRMARDVTRSIVVASTSKEFFGTDFEVAMQ